MWVGGGVAGGGWVGGLVWVDLCYFVVFAWLLEGVCCSLVAVRLFAATWVCYLCSGGGTVCR